MSAVVNGRATENGIAPGTAERVLEAARKLAYVPNLTARNLKGKQNKVLGVHTFEAVFPLSQRDFYHEFLMGVEQQAVAEGYDLMLFTSTEGEDGKRHVYRNGANRLRLADGSVLIGSHPDSDDMSRLAAEGYPIVFIGRRELPGVTIPYVTGDYAAVTSDVVSRLAERGHECLVYVGEPGRLESLRDREEGMRSGCERTGVRALAPHYTKPSALTADWLDSARRQGATAVLVEDPDLAVRLAELAQARNVSIPQDLSVVVLHNAVRGPVANWSAIGIPRNNIGRTAVQLLVAMLRDPDAQREHQIVLPCEPPTDSTIAPAPQRHSK